MLESPDIRVLVTGDDEADLAFVCRALAVPSEVVTGLGLAVAAMRMRAFGVLIADVHSSQDALALLRAARRGRPSTRGIVLAPADQRLEEDGWELVERAAFAVIRHPVHTPTLHAAIEAASLDYLAERRGVSRPPAPTTERDREHTRWLLAERRLAAVLRRTVTDWTTQSQGGVEEAIRQGVEAMSEATRYANGSPDVLLAIAEALSEVREKGRGREDRADEAA